MLNSVIITILGMSIVTFHIIFSYGIFSIPFFIEVGCIVFAFFYFIFRSQPKKIQKKGLRENRNAKEPSFLSSEQMNSGKEDVSRIKTIMKIILIIFIVYIFLIAPHVVSAEKDQWIEAEKYFHDAEKKCVSITFLYDEKHENERRIVRNILNISEAEEEAEGAMKKAFIGIARMNIKDDDEAIFAYIKQELFCGSGGSQCTFLILHQNQENKWSQLLTLGAGEEICLSISRHNGPYDLIFKETLSDASEHIHSDVLHVFDGQQYRPVLKREKLINKTVKTRRISIWSYSIDEKWTLVGCRKFTAE